MREQDASVKIPESLAELETVAFEWIQVLTVSSMYSISLERYVQAVKPSWWEVMRCPDIIEAVQADLWTRLISHFLTFLTTLA